MAGTRRGPSDLGEGWCSRTVTMETPSDPEYVLELRVWDDEGRRTGHRLDRVNRYRCTWGWGFQTPGTPVVSFKDSVSTPVLRDILVDSRSYLFGFSERHRDEVVE